MKKLWERLGNWLLKEMHDSNRPMPSRYEETRSGEGFFFVLYFGLA